VDVINCNQINERSKIDTGVAPLASSVLYKITKIKQADHCQCQVELAIKGLVKVIVHMGYRLTPKGILPDSDKLKAVQDS
jgi:hypothetical protein